MLVEREDVPAEFDTSGSANGIGHTIA